MFSFGENGDRIVATATVEIQPRGDTEPHIWTPELKPFRCRRVYMIFAETRRGRQTIRVYPLKPRSDKFPPAFVLVGNDSPYLTMPTTHVCLRHEAFSIIRPLNAVYYRAKWAVEKGRMDLAPDFILVLVKHAYFTDMLSDEAVEEVEGDFEKLEAILARMESTDYAGEAQACERALSRLCRRLLDKITDEITEDRL